MENYNEPTLSAQLAKKHLISKSSLRLHFRTDHSSMKKKLKKTQFKLRSTGQIFPTEGASREIVTQDL